MPRGILIRLGAIRLVVLASVGLTAGTAAGALAAGQADLVVTAVNNPPTTAPAGSSFRVRDTTKNAGSANARSTHTRYYLSRDAKRSKGDRRLKGRRRVRGLHPGGSSRALVRLGVPRTARGKYRLLACADDRRKVDEGSERNNCRAASKAVTVVADLPLVQTARGLVRTTDGGATLIDPRLKLRDRDSATLRGAIVRVTAGFQSGDDQLQFTNQNGITGTYNSGTGVLTLTGTATVAEYRKALRSVRYRNAPGGASDAPRVLALSVNDGTNQGPEALVVAVLNSPVVKTSSGAASFAEGGAPVVIDPGLTVSDPDDATLAGASVQLGLTIPTGSGNDKVTFVDQLGITGTYNSGTGVLTLTGTSTVANYQTALRSVRFSNGSSNPSTARRTATFRAFDGSSWSAPARRRITVHATP